MQFRILVLVSKMSELSSQSQGKIPIRPIVVEMGEYVVRIWVNRNGMNVELLRKVGQGVKPQRIGRQRVDFDTLLHKMRRVLGKEEFRLLVSDYL